MEKVGELPAQTRFSAKESFKQRRGTASHFTKVLRRNFILK